MARYSGGAMKRFLVFPVVMFGLSILCSANVRFPRPHSAKEPSYRPCSPLITASTCSIDTPPTLRFFRHGSFPRRHLVLAFSRSCHISSVSMSASHLGPLALTRSTFATYDPNVLGPIAALSSLWHPRRTVGGPVVRSAVHCAVCTCLGALTGRWP